MQDKVHAPLRPGGARLEGVDAFTSASPRQSLSTAAGALRVDPIDGVRYRLARPVSHHHGHLTEAFRALDGGAHRVIDAIADDEDLDVVDALRLHARHGERQGCGGDRGWE